jgi:hypothetical protein
VRAGQAGPAVRRVGKSHATNGGRSTQALTTPAAGPPPSALPLTAKARPSGRDRKKPARYTDQPCPLLFRRP